MKLAKDFGVRALFAVLSYVGALGLCFYLAVHNKLPSEALMVMIGIPGVAGAFYFGQKTAQL